MLRANDGNYFVVDKRLEFQVRECRRTLNEPQIDLARNDAGYDVRGIGADHRQFDAGMPAHKAGKHPRQQILRNRGRGAKTQTSALFAIQPADFSNSCICQTADVVRISEKMLPGGGQAHAARGAIEQTNPKLLFERLDVRCDGWLSDAQYLGGLRETKTLRYDSKDRNSEAFDDRHCVPAVAGILRQAPFKGARMEFNTPSNAAGSTAAAREWPPRPSRERLKVVGFGLTLAFITYIDRAAIGQVAPALSSELRLSPLQMGYVFMAFGVAYSIFELPSGWLGDRIGPRKVLLRIVLWWSFFTAATGWAGSFASLLITRFLFGAGEAGCFPNLAKCFQTWLPFRERLKAEGLKSAGARWGGAVTPLIFFYLRQWLAWRAIFQVLALLGAVWAAAFYLWYRDDPRDNRNVNQAELALLAPNRLRAASRRNPPWRVFLRSRSAWLLWTQWFCYSYGFYFYLTWLPTYLQQARKLDLHRSATLAALPLFSAGAGSIFSGWACAALMRRTGKIAAVRRGMAFCGFGCAAANLSAFMYLHDPVWAIGALALSSFAAELSGPVSWTTCMDLGGRYVGSLAGAMNTLGQLGGAVAPAVIGYVLERTNHNWTYAFYISIAVDLGGILCWALIDPVTPLDNEATMP